MKSKILIIYVLCLFLGAEAIGQIKVHDDNSISIGSLNRDYGIQVAPNGYTYFSPSIFDEYKWLNLTYAKRRDQGCYIVDFDGEHTFFVNSEGYVYAKNGYVTSDSTLKTDIKNIANPLKSLMKLHGVSFRYKEKAESKDTITYQDRYGKTHTIVTGTGEDQGIYDKNYVNSKAVDSLISEKKRKFYGVIAQEVEKELPSLVRTKPDGIKVVNYNGIIGIMIEAIKEQQKEIDLLKESLKLQGDNPEGFEGKILKSEINLNESNSCENALFQNVPNPFSQSTKIEFKISQSSESVSMLIFNMQGALLKSYSILDEGKGELIINGNEFKPGMYLYSLIVDGKEVGLKRMILTER